jgi:carbonic anhydrase
VQSGLHTAEEGKVNSLPGVFMIGRLWPTVAALLVFCSVRVPYVAMAQEHSAHEWGYSGGEGPSHWGELRPEFAVCKSGHRQSPVNIAGAQSAALPAIQFEYKPSGLHIINNGHTVQIDYAPGSFIRIGDKRYELKQFHFHHPSEETIKGKRFPMELHLVHSDADGNLAVVSVLLKEGSANPLVETLWSVVPKKAGPEKTDDTLQINVADLLPANRGYFTFSGSLTTPPCTEGVSWFVLKTPVTISSNQVATFAKIYPFDERPTQPLNGRTVLESK